MPGKTERSGTGGYVEMRPFLAAERATSSSKSRVAVYLTRTPAPVVMANGNTLDDWPSQHPHYFSDNCANECACSSWRFHGVQFPVLTEIFRLVPGALLFGLCLPLFFIRSTLRKVAVLCCVLLRLIHRRALHVAIGLSEMSDANNGRAQLQTVVAHSLNEVYIIVNRQRESARIN